MDGGRKLMGFDWQYGVADVPARDAFSCRGENETEFYRQDAQRYSHIGALVRFAVMDIARRAHHGAGGCIVIDVFEPDLIAFYRDEIGFRELHPALDEWNKLYRSGNHPRMMMYMPISKAAEWAARAGLMPL